MPCCKQKHNQMHCISRLKLNRYWTITNERRISHKKIMGVVNLTFNAASWTTFGNPVTDPESMDLKI